MNVALRTALILFPLAHSACSAPPSSSNEESADIPAFQGLLPDQNATMGNNGGSGNPSGSGGSSFNTAGANGEIVNVPGNVDPGNGGSSNINGNSNGGSSSSGGGAGGSGSQNPPPAGDASPGCGQSQGVPQNPNVPNTILTFPNGYDGSTPFPLVFAFHGAGRTNEEQRLDDSRTEGSELEQNYLVAYMKSAGNGWDIGADYPRFEAVLEQIQNERCVDTSRIFAFGHSSGAQFIVQMLGDNRTRETRFAAVVPVASSRFFNPDWAPIPTLVIHGLNDTQRGGDNSGASDIVQYTQSNQCTNDTQPLDVPSCSSFAGGVSVNAGCRSYVGCAAPTLFCNHDDPNYLDGGQPTNHGWPCFANSQIFQFFESVQ